MTAHVVDGDPVRPPLLVGVSTVGYRCEGGFNGPGQPANQWAAWERVGALDGLSPGVDLWRHPDAAVEQAAAVGAQVFAMGVEWARVEPAPGHFDEAALARYAAILALAASRGLEPVVTLQDLAHPQWLGEEFWLTPGAPDRFAEHAGRVVEQLSAHCRHWVTVRQPSHLAFGGWVAGSLPPRRLAAVSDAWAVLDNLCSAHVLAYDEIHRVQSDATVAMGVRRASSYDAHRLAVDLVCAPQLGADRSGVDAWVDERRALYDAALPPDDLADLGRRRVTGLVSPFGGRSRALRRPSPRRVLDVVYGRAGTALPLDALWVVWRPRPAPAGSGGNVAKDAAALSAWCTAHQVITPGLPLWIEDGVAIPSAPPAAPSGSRGGYDRPSYVRASLGALSEARAGGTHVAGYVYHCLGPDSELALSPSTWTPRLLSHVMSAPGLDSGRGTARSRCAATAGNLGLFDVVASFDGEPAWQECDANGDRAGDALRRLADIGRASRASRPSRAAHDGNDGPPVIDE